MYNQIYFKKEKGKSTQDIDCVVFIREKMHGKIEKTKKALREAILDMVNDLSVQDISVSLLCERAGINRSTFYKYYRIPEDVISEYVSETYHTFLQNALKETSGFINTYDLLLLQCHLFYNDKTLSKLYLFCYQRHKINPEMMFANMPIVMDSDLLYFISGGIDACITEWIKTGFLESPEAMAEKMTGYIERILPKSEFP